MLDKPNALHTLGLELGSAAIKAALVCMNRGKIKIDQLLEIQLDPQVVQTGHVNPLYTTEEGKGLLSAMAKNLVATTLNSSEVLVRPLEIKLHKDRDVDAVLAFQAEPILPYPTDNAVVDRIKLAQSKEGTLLTVLAVRKDHLQHHLDQWKALDVEPEIISSVPAALAAFGNFVVPESRDYFLFHLGYSHTSCIYIKDGKLIAAQNSPQNLDVLKQAFAKDQQIEDAKLLNRAFANLDWSKISAEETPALTEALESYRLDLTRTLYALAKQAKGHEVADILLTGDGAILPHLGEALGRHLGKTLLTPQPAGDGAEPVADLLRYAIPVGAALTGLPKGFDQINFRQNEFEYPHPWKRLKQPLAIFLGLCALLAGAFYVFNQTYAGYREDQIRTEYTELLHLMHKPYDDFEKEIAVKTGAARKGEEIAVPPVKSLTAEDIRVRLGYLDKELQSTPDIFPLMPNVPRVSDVLAWLSTHPKVASKDLKTGALNPLIQIDNFSYTMVKRPELTKKQEKYQVKVEMEFSSPNPTLAREFHDALIAPNDFVDPKGEVKWSTNKGKYKATFFLKDKTVYPGASK